MGTPKKEEIFNLLAPDCRAALERGEGRKVTDAEVERVVEFIIATPASLEDMLAKLALVEGLRRGIVDARWDEESDQLQVRLRQPAGDAEVEEEAKVEG